MYYFSPSNNAFYPSDLIDAYQSSGSWPEDVRIVPDEVFMLYSSTPPQGRYRGVDDKGDPIWVLAENKENLVAAERFWRNQQLSISDIHINKLQDGYCKGSIKEWRNFRNALREWPQHERFPDKNFRPKQPT
jgi:hypothetical protein